jgi:alkylation response protein AidB-like acyl-CoA dehydrogenase
MTDYAAPLPEMRFVLDEIAELRTIARLPGFEDATDELVDQILAEAGKFATGVLAPINRAGDEEGSRLENGAVVTPKGFREAYQAFAEGGWNSVPFETEWGGQGLPWTVSIALQEMWSSANMAFSLCPLLTQGAIEALQRHGSPEQKTSYLPKLISGKWTGTMNLTEPQAGSDVGALRTRAVKDGDCYRITGQKIFITYGEQDLSENIIHLVLARTPNAPAGTKGISLFIVPKFLPNADGSLGARNDLRCLSLEHKLGIKASPTCVMAYGETDGGAIGFLVGEEQRGMEYMFTMMNNARLSVGVEGLAIAERALQQARSYARERVQSRPVDAKSADPAPIIRHPDVRRMLMTMRSLVEAMRALTYLNAAALDHAKRAPDEAARSKALMRAELLTPLSKAWSTDRGIDVASLNIQIHGGLGFIESTGAAQHLRDVRIAPIYEGTNGIQAIDLVGRKLGRDQGGAMATLIADMRADVENLGAEGDQDLSALATALAPALDDLAKTTEWIVERLKSELPQVLAGATPYLDLAGTTVGGWLLARQALAARRRLAAGTDDDGYLPGKIATALFFAANILPRVHGLAAAVTNGADSTLRLPPDQV